MLAFVLNIKSTKTTKEAHGVSSEAAAATLLMDRSTFTKLSWASRYCAIPSLEGSSTLQPSSLSLD